jgi:uncharacterized membrane protein YdjX (TVP38/TMEM64 family)
VRRLSTAARVLVTLEVLVAIALAARLLPLEPWLRGLEARLSGIGPLAPLVYVLMYAVAVVAFVPGSLLTMGAGLLFGPALGFVTASTGATAGASLAFLVARHLARSQVEGWARKSPRFAAIDGAIGEQGYGIVALTRLSPVFPFNVLNYAYGVTRVSFRSYVLASWIAMMPGCLLYTYLGSLGRAGASALAGSPVETYRVGLNVLGLVSTVAATVLVTRMARRALATVVAPAETPSRVGRLTSPSGPA